MGLVDHDQDGVPECTRRRDQRFEEPRHEVVSLVRLKLVDVDNGADPELEKLPREEVRAPGLRGTVAAFDAGARQHVVVLLPQREELPLDVEHELLHTSVRLLEQAADRPALAAAAVRLEQEACLHEAVDIDPQWAF